MARGLKKDVASIDKINANVTFDLERQKRQEMAVMKKEKYSLKRKLNTTASIGVPIKRQNVQVPSELESDIEKLCIR